MGENKKTFGFTVLAVCCDGSAAAAVSAAAEDAGAVRCDVVKDCAAARALFDSRGCDLLVIDDADRQLSCDFARTLCEAGECELLLLAAPATAAALRRTLAGSGALVLCRPPSDELLCEAIRLCFANRAKMTGLQCENRRLQLKIEELRLVDRAKWALVEYLKMSEADAHRYIEKQAMDLRVSRAVVANNILKTYTE